MNIQKLEIPQLEKLYHAHMEKDFVPQEMCIRDRCTSGHWEDDNTFQVVCRWIETCLTKKVNFHFDEDGSGFTVDASSNSAFPTKFDPKFDSIRGVVE